MKLVYGISRWSNASRAAARHIATAGNKPLCGGNGRKAFSWEMEEGEPTCEKCKRLLETSVSGVLRLEGWAGITKHPVRVVGQTLTRYRVELIEKTKLPGRNKWGNSGDIVLVPKHAVSLNEATP